MKIFAFILLALLLASSIHAQSAAPWSWSNYSGKTYWNVVYTEDDRACSNGGIYTTKGQITMTHNQATVSFRDEHGQVTGTFISPNILHVKGRPTTDSTGARSVISDYDLFFTTDCLSFAGTYSWDYTDQYGGSCSGTTRMAGTNMAGSCPEAGPITPEPETSPETGPGTPSITPPSGSITGTQTIEQRVAAAHADLKEYLNEKYQINGVTKEELQLLHAKVDGAYEGILHDDPTNGQANCDMAQLKLNDGKEDEFKKYMDQALKSNFDKTKTTDSMKTATQKELGLPDPPNPYHSSFVRIMNEEKNNWQGGLKGSDPATDSADKTSFMMRLYSLFAPPPSVVDTLVFK